MQPHAFLTSQLHTSYFFIQHEIGSALNEMWNVLVVQLHHTLALVINTCFTNISSLNTQTHAYFTIVCSLYRTAGFLATHNQFYCENAPATLHSCTHHRSIQVVIQLCCCQLGCSTAGKQPVCGNYTLLPTKNVLLVCKEYFIE